MSVYGLVQGFIRVTGWLPQKLVFRLKVHYEDKAAQSRRIHGPAIIVSNHTAIYDFAAMLFLFPGRTLRYQMAEVLFNKQPLGMFVKSLGGIRINRDAHEVGGLSISEEVLRHGGVVGIFPEGRLPKPGEERPLPFRNGAAWLAITTGIPVIPVYTEGGYFNPKPSHVMIGKPMTFSGAADQQSLKAVTEEMRAKIIDLGRKMENDKG